MSKEQKAKAESAVLPGFIAELDVDIVGIASLAEW